MSYPDFLKEKNNERCTVNTDCHNACVTNIRFCDIFYTMDITCKEGR